MKAHLILSPLFCLHDEIPDFQAAPTPLQVHYPFPSFSDESSDLEVIDEEEEESPSAAFAHFISLADLFPSEDDKILEMTSIEN